VTSQAHNRAGELDARERDHQSPGKVPGGGWQCDVKLHINDFANILDTNTVQSDSSIAKSRRSVSTVTPVPAGAVDQINNKTAAEGAAEFNIATRELQIEDKGRCS